MTVLKITATIIVSAALVFAVYATTQPASPTVAILYGEEYRLLKENDLAGAPGVTPCFALINLIIKQAEQQILNDHNIQPDQEYLAEQRKLNEGAITTESLQQLLEVTNNQIAVAEPFLEQYGDNNATDENIDRYLKDHETSPVLSSLDRAHVAFTLRQHLPTRKHIENLKKNMVYTIDPFVEQLDQNIQYAAKYITLRRMIVNHPVTDEDVQRAWQSPSADPIWSELSQTDMKLHLAREKEDYIFSSFLLRKVKADITVLDAEKYNQCLNEWEKKFISPWAAIFSDTEIPDESILQNVP